MRPERRRSFDGLVIGVVGLPSPSGSNHLVLDDASSAVVSPIDGENGLAFANAWPAVFG